MSRTRFTQAFDLHNMVPGPAGVATPHVIYKSEDGILLCYGTTVPTDDAAGYAKGCEFFHTDGDINDKLYVNDGDADDCDFNLAPGEGLIQYVTVKATAAQINDSHTVPITLVAAPGTGKAIEYISGYGFLDSSGTGFSAVGSGIFIGTVKAGAVGWAFIAATEDMIFLSHAGGESDVVAQYINTALTYQLDSTSTGGGTSTLTLKIAYRIHDFN